LEEAQCCGGDIKRQSEDLEDVQVGENNKLRSKEAPELNYMNPETVVMPKDDRDVVPSMESSPKQTGDKEDDLVNIGDKENVNVTIESLVSIEDSFESKKPSFSHEEISPENIAKYSSCFVSLEDINNNQGSEGVDHSLLRGWSSKEARPKVLNNRKVNQRIKCEFCPSMVSFNQYITHCKNMHQNSPHSEFVFCQICAKEKRRKHPISKVSLKFHQKFRHPELFDKPNHY
jgi:hypothetical protein